MNRYTLLKSWLADQPAGRVPMTFKQIEGVLGRPLPQSAYRYRAWWSNNPDNNVMTRAWRDAGFESAEVDMAAQTLVFQRVRPMDFFKAEQQRGVQAHGVAEMAMTGLQGLSLSDRAKTWLAASGSAGKAALAEAIERAAARDARMAVIAKYRALSLSGGADSVDLIREDRDGR